MLVAMALGSVVQLGENPGLEHSSLQYWQHGFLLTNWHLKVQVVNADHLPLYSYVAIAAHELLIASREPCLASAC